MPTSKVGQALLPAAGSPAGSSYSGSQRGSALLAVLWLSIALSAIAFSVASSVRAETERTATSVDQLRAYYLATGSVDRAVLWMTWGGYSNPDGSPRYYRPPMPQLHYSYATGDVLVEVIPEGAKLNVNTAKIEDIVQLLYTIGLDSDRAQRIARGILVYRTALDPGAPPVGFAGGSTFQPRHASLQELEELLLVPGITPDIFYGRFDRDPAGRLVPRGGLRDYLTVWGGAGTVDINTAAPAVLESLGLNPGLVQQIVTRRIVRPFTDPAEVQSIVQGAGPQAARIGIGGATIWTLRATARIRTPGGQLSDVRRTVAAVVKLRDQSRPWELQGPESQVLRWYDESWSPDAVPF